MPLAQLTPSITAPMEAWKWEESVSYTAFSRQFCRDVELFWKLWKNYLRHLHGSVRDSWLLFDFSSSSVGKCEEPLVALAHPASLPSTPGDSMCIKTPPELPHCQHSSGFEMLRTSHTTLSPHWALHSAQVLLQEQQLCSCQVPVAGNWETCENMGCVPGRRFCRALV